MTWLVSLRIELVESAICFGRTSSPMSMKLYCAGQMLILHIVTFITCVVWLFLLCCYAS